MNEPFEIFTMAEGYNVIITVNQELQRASLQAVQFTEKYEKRSIDGRLNKVDDQWELYWSKGYINELGHGKSFYCDCPEAELTFEEFPEDSEQLAGLLIEQFQLFIGEKEKANDTV